MGGNSISMLLLNGDLLRVRLTECKPTMMRADLLLTLEGPGEAERR